MKRALPLAILLGCTAAPAERTDPERATKTPIASASVETVTLSRPPTAAPRAVASCDPAQRGSGPLRFTLLHVNDLQARYSDRLAGRSRYAYIAGYMKAEKAKGPTLIVDAGDDYEKGALAELRSSGETTRQMVQALPLDVRVIGNHDFAYGEPAVLRDARSSRHPLLAANIRHVGSPPTAQPFLPYARVDVGCVKVGVIGLVTQAFGADDRPTSSPYDDVFVQDEHYQAIMEREAKAHRDEVDVLVGLTHLGYADDLALASHGGKLCDLIVGGHTEDLLKQPQAIIHPDKTRTFVVQAGHYGERIGRGDVVVYPSEDRKRKVGLEGYVIVDVDERLPPDEEVAALAKRLEDAVAPDAHAAVGHLSAPVARGKPMAELLFHAAAATWNIDALAVGRDTFWSGLPKGDVTLQRIYDTVLVQRQPAGTSGFTSIWMAELSGAELMKLAKAFHGGGLYEWVGPKTKLDPDRRYRFAIDKRGATYARSLFGAAGKNLETTMLGEMIDAFEPWARARTAKGLPLDRD